MTVTTDPSLLIDRLILASEQGSVNPLGGQYHRVFIVILRGEEEVPVNQLEMLYDLCSLDRTGAVIECNTVSMERRFYKIVIHNFRRSFVKAEKT